MVLVLSASPWGFFVGGRHSSAVVSLAVGLFSRHGHELNAIECEQLCVKSP